MTLDDLKSIQRKRWQINNRKERIEALRCAASYPARQLGELSNISSDVRDKLAENIAEIIDLERKLALDVLSIEQDVQKIDRDLEKLPENQERVVRLRYCDGLQWDAVAKKAGWCVSRCKNIHTEFLKDKTLLDSNP